MGALRALLQDPAWAANITHVNLSYNRLDDGSAMASAELSAGASTSIKTHSGAEALAGWLNSASGLQRLQLAGCFEPSGRGADLELVLRALADNSVLSKKALKLLDVAYNAFCIGAAPALSRVFVLCCEHGLLGRF